MTNDSGDSQTPKVGNGTGEVERLLVGFVERFGGRLHNKVVGVC